MPSVESPTSIKQLREGDFAKAFRWIVAVGAILPMYRYLGHGIGFVLIAGIVQLALYELVATLIIWTIKLLAYGMRRDDAPVSASGTPSVSQEEPMPAAKPPTSIRQLREGKIAAVFRVVVGIYAIILGFINPASEPLGYLISAALSFIISQIIASVIIWALKLLAYGMVREKAYWAKKELS